MYNLLVTSQAGQWDESAYRYEFPRVAREHTTESLTRRFGSLDKSAIEELMSFPALFAYEQGEEADARVGRITSIKTRERMVKVEYEFETELPPISAAAIKGLVWDLEINAVELYRTHWAVKEADLIQILKGADLIETDFVWRSAKDSQTEITETKASGPEVETISKTSRIQRKKSSSKSNSDLLETLQDRLHLEIESALKDLVEDINALKRANSAKGLLKSGATLKGVRELCKSTIFNLAKGYTSAIGNAVEKQIIVSEPDLQGILHRLFTEAIYEILAFASDRISETAKMVGKEDLADRLTEEVSAHYDFVSAKLLTDLKISASTLQVEEKKNAQRTRVVNWTIIGVLIALAGLIYSNT